MPFPTETTNARENLEAAGGHLDLVQAPFTLPRSRLIIFAQGEGLRVCTSEYEKRLAECVVFENLRVHGADGRVLPVTRVLPHVIEFGGGARHAELRRALGPEHRPGSRAHAGTSTIHWQTPDGLAHSMSAGQTPAGSVHLAIDSDRRATATHADLHARTRGGDRADLAGLVRQVPARSARTCRTWPRSAGGCSAPTSSRLPALGSARAVVPSKIGYVGLWQWDAYFIAVGLRHGDPELAREQLSLAFGFPRDRRPAAGRRARARHPRHQRRPAGLRPRDPASRRLRDRRPLGPGAADQAAAGGLGAAQGAGGPARGQLRRRGLGGRQLETIAARRTGGSPPPTSTATACPNTATRTPRASTTARSSTARCPPPRRTSAPTWCCRTWSWPASPSAGAVQARRNWRSSTAPVPPAP